jgi:DNA-binding CsgD family transcriptional regulator
MPDTNDLSEREREILRLVASGASNKQIAHALTISTNTVKVHLRNIFTKIEVGSRTEAAMYAVRAGLVRPEAVPGEVSSGLSAGLSLGKGEATLDLPARGLAGQRLGVWGWIILAVFLVVIAAGGFYLWSLREAANPPAVQASPPAPEQAPRWLQISPMPTPRKGLAVAAYENQIYAIAGETEEGVTGVVERYDPALDQWMTLSPKPAEVTEASAVVIGGRIFVPGGRLADGSSTDLLQIYDPRADAWEDGASLPEALSAYAIAPFEGRLFLFGGKNETGYLSTVYVYDPTRDEWEAGPPMSTARGYLGAAVAAGKIFVVGGYNGQEIFRKTEIFLPDRLADLENPWVAGPALPDGRYQMGVASIADIIFVLGGIGEAGSPTSVIESFSQENEWTAVEIDLPDSWSIPSLVPIETKLFLLGGEKDGVPTGLAMEYQAIYTLMIPVIR